MIRAIGARTLASCAAAVFAVSASAVQTLSVAEYQVSYDQTTSFGSISSWFGSGSTVGFSWNVPTSAAVAGAGGTFAVDLALPSFTLTPGVGYALSGPLAGFIGNFVFNEYSPVGSTASASATISGTVSVNAASTSFSLPLTKSTTTTIAAIGFTGGTLSGSPAVPAGSFSSLTFSGGNLHLQVVTTAAGFGSIIGQGQNQLTASFTATPVPEPETYALMLSGIGVVLVLSRRRRAD